MGELVKGLSELAAYSILEAAGDAIGSIPLNRVGAVAAAIAITALIVS